MLSQGSSEPVWYRINRLLLIHLGLHFNSNQILKDYEHPYFDGAQYIYLLFISYEPRTVNKTADVRIVFSQQSALSMSLMGEVLMGANFAIQLHSSEFSPQYTVQYQ